MLPDAVFRLRACSNWQPRKNTFELKAETGCDCAESEIENDKKWDIGYSFRSGKPIIVNDYAQETRFALLPALEGGEIRSSILVALKGSKKKFGVLGLYSKEAKEFSENDRYFIQTVASILAGAIEQHQAKETLSKTNAKLQKALESSRIYQKKTLDKSILQHWKMGEYLSENLAQLLVAAKILINNLQRTFPDSDSGNIKKLKNTRYY